MFELEWMLAFMQQQGLIGGFVISLIGNASLFLPLPAVLAIYLIAPTQNPLLLGAVTGIAAALGEAVGYAVGYGIKKGTSIDTKFEKEMKITKKLFDKYGFWLVVLFGATPLPDDLVGIVCGLAHYPFGKFLTANMIGKIIMYTIVAYAGYYSFEFVRTVFIEQTIIWNVIFLAVLAVFMLILKNKIGWEGLLERMG